MADVIPLIFAALIPAVFFIYIFYRSSKYKKRTKNEIEGKIINKGTKVDAGVRKR